MNVLLIGPPGPGKSTQASLLAERLTIPRITAMEVLAAAALHITSADSSCCSGRPVAGECDPVTSNLYEADETAGLPAEAVAAPLGCGNSTALAQLNPGETVLDLGSRGGGRQGSRNRARREA